MSGSRGEPTVALTITPQGAVGQVGVALVDYGTQVRVKDDGAGNVTLGTQSCWGQSTPYDDACYFDSVENQVSTPLAVIARGWARLTGNQSNTLTVHLAFNDVVIPAGHQLGLAIFGASPSWLTNLDTHATPYSVNLGVSSLSLPVVGSVGFGPNAGDLGQVPAVVSARDASLAVPGNEASRLRRRPDLIEQGWAEGILPSGHGCEGGTLWRHGGLGDVDVLYGDQESGRRTISRFSIAPAGDARWLCAAVRHWSLDGEAR